MTKKERIMRSSGKGRRVVSRGRGKGDRGDLTPPSTWQSFASPPSPPLMPQRGGPRDGGLEQALGEELVKSLLEENERLKHDLQRVRDEQGNWRK